MNVDSSEKTDEEYCNCNNVDIVHTDGYKDEYLVEVQFSDSTDSWAPTNEDIFQMIDLWFESEDAEFGDGYGRWMPMFYVGLIAIGETEKAQAAYGKRGYEAVEHFEQCVEDHGEEIIEQIKKLS